MGRDWPSRSNGRGSSRNGNISDQASEGVRRATDECWMEASLYRAYPAAIVTGVATLTWLTRGKRAGTNTRLGLALKTSAAAVLAFWAGKLQYLSTKHCRDKFLQYAPDSKIAKSIQQNRRAQGSNAKSTYQSDRGVPATAPATTNSETTVTFPDQHGREIEVQMTEEEQKVLDECAKVSLYFFSFPSTVLCFSSAIYLQSRGHFQSSKWVNPPLNKLPKALTFGVAGFVAGQWLYLRSGDCQDRFLHRAPRGQLVNLIRQAKNMEPPHLPPEPIYKTNPDNSLLKPPQVPPYFDHHKQTEYSIPKSSGPLIGTESSTVGKLLEEDSKKTV